jgi:hypothetical protein
VGTRILSPELEHVVYLAQQHELEERLEHLRVARERGLLVRREPVIKRGGVSHGRDQAGAAMYAWLFWLPPHRL